MQYEQQTRPCSAPPSQAHVCCLCAVLLAKQFRGRAAVTTGHVLEGNNVSADALQIRLRSRRVNGQLDAVNAFDELLVLQQILLGLEASTWASMYRLPMECPRVKWLPSWYGR